MLYLRNQYTCIHTRVNFVYNIDTFAGIWTTVSDNKIFEKTVARETRCYLLGSFLNIDFIRNWYKLSTVCLDENCLDVI